MQEANLSILRPLKQNIEEIVAPLEAAQLETYAENKENVQRGYQKSLVNLNWSKVNMGLNARLASLRRLQSATGEELSAWLPSILDKAFKGEL